MSVDISHLKDLLGKKLEIMDKIVDVSKPSDEFQALRNESAIADIRLKNALFDAAPDLIRLAEIGAAANQIGNKRVDDGHIPSFGGRGNE